VVLRLNKKSIENEVIGRADDRFGGLRLIENQAQKGTSSKLRQDVVMGVATIPSNIRWQDRLRHNGAARVLTSGVLLNWHFAPVGAVRRRGAAAGKVKSELKRVKSSETDGCGQSFLFSRFYIHFSSVPPSS